MKKFIVFILFVTLALVHFLGCYDKTVLSKEDFSDASMQVWVITVDAKKYSFEENEYHVTRDTLFGKGQRILESGQGRDFAGSIPLASIQSLEVHELNEVRTVLGVVGGILVGGLVFVALLSTIDIFGNK